MKRSAAYALEIDDHGLAGDGKSGKFGTCTVCKRRNKVVTLGPEPRCIMPRLVEFLPENQRPDTGCEAQRGPRPTKRTR
jgi:hypothetical protein